MEKQTRTTFDNQLIELESVDSTNNYAMALVHEGLASDGLVCLAHHQLAGKGQRGRTWESAPSQNLMMSLIIEPGTLILSEQFLLSAAVSLGILDVFQRMHAFAWHIKWPNDLYWNDRKAAGILIENALKGSEWRFAVVGIGINLNQVTFPETVPNAVSFRQITGQTYRAVDVAKEIVPAIQERIRQLRQNPADTLAGFNAALYKKNERVLLRKGPEQIEVTLHGVDSAGLLLTSAGRFTLGELQFIPQVLPPTA